MVTSGASAVSFMEILLDPTRTTTCGCPWPIPMTTYAAIVAVVIMPGSISQMINDDELMGRLAG